MTEAETIRVRGADLREGDVLTGSGTTIIQARRARYRDARLRPDPTGPYIQVWVRYPNGSETERAWSARTSFQVRRPA